MIKSFTFTFDCAKRVYSIQISNYELNFNRENIDVSVLLLLLYYVDTIAG